MEEDKAGGESGLPRDADYERDEWKSRAFFYRAIIERYRDYINDREQKTIPALKSLIDPSDPTIAALRDGIAQKIKDEKESALAGQVVETKELEYFADTDFPKAAAMAYEHAKALLRTGSEIQLSFWLKYPEMETLGIADSFDKALLLCSLLFALGGKDARVTVLELEDGSSHPVVTLAIGGKFILLDPDNAKAAFGEIEAAEKSELLAEYLTLDGKKASRISYEFNRDEYEEKDEE